MASQPLCPREPIMCPLRSRKDHCLLLRRGWRISWFHLDLDALAAEPLLARPSVLPTTPIFPEQGCGTDDEGMQEHTHEGSAWQ